MNTPLIGPCEGDCGPDHRGRICPCYPVDGRWLCHDCIQHRQAETAARLRAVADGGRPNPEEYTAESYCPNCDRHTQHMIRDDGRFERCTICGTEVLG